jgi:hypothetical protein
MSAIRNKNGIWINSQVFREAALKFIRDGRYCDEIAGSVGWNEFWDEEKNRCENGYSVGGATITGEHYFYMNYCPIKRIFADPSEKQVAKNKNVARKSMSFPDFWDGDYNYFHIKQIAAFGATEEYVKSLNLDVVIKDFNGGKHLIVGKARRKGFSYKNGSVATHQYTFQRDSLALICAFDKKYLYPKGTMTMADSYSNFLNENTAFFKRRLIDKQDHIKAGFKEKIEGIEIEKGFKSEILALTFKDNPDAARGKDAGLVLMEEVGDWPKMKEAYSAILPTVQDGSVVTGQLIMFGTGGDMTGGTIAFNEMYYNPEPYNLLAFDNIWDDNASNTTAGYFFPVHQNLNGYIDAQGNSLKEEAIAAETKKREEIALTAKDKGTLTRYMTEWPFNPREAFSLSSGNIFDGATLLKHLGFLESSTDGNIKGTYGTLEFNSTTKGLDFVVNEKLKPADFPVVDSSKAEGCIVIWEHPVSNPPYGLYIAGNDPYDQDKASNSLSLGSVIIMKRAMPGYDNHDKIVAEYTGRPASAKEFYENTRKLLLYYNALCLYENEKTGIKSYFEQQNSLFLLAFTPTILKSNANTTVSRIYGQHMQKNVKEELEVVLRDWLNMNVGEGKTQINMIFSKPLLKELIQYNPEGNFDRVIAFMLCIAQSMQMHRIIIREAKDRKIDPFFTRKLNIG